jgi:hypothetical protein
MTNDGKHIMDSYIVRIYRRISNKNGEVNEAVGLVEKVSNGGKTQSFSNYSSLVRLLKEQEEQPENQSSHCAPDCDAETPAGIRGMTVVSGGRRS